MTFPVPVKLLLLFLFLGFGLAAASSTNTLTLAWTPSATPGVIYIVQWGTTATPFLFGGQPSTNTTWSVTGLAAGTYVFRVVASNAGGLSLPSNAVTNVVSGTLTVHSNKAAQ